MNNIKLSACIVTYNSSNIILEAIKGLLAATKDYHFDFYISDNCSTDNTVELIKSNFPEVKVIINEQNRGFGAGHNAVLPLLESDYHFVINPDIIANNESINLIIDFMENNKDVVMLCPKILNEDKTEQILPKRNPKFKYLLSRRVKLFKKWEAEYTMRNDKLDEVVDIDFCTGCFFVIRTDVFKKVNGFDDIYFMYFEDADLSRKAKEYGRVVMYQKPYVIHKWERASAKSLKFLKIQIQSMFKYFKKWK